MKQIPNLFTLLNLVFGCLAIVFTLQQGVLLLPLDPDGNLLVTPQVIENYPEKMVYASIFIGLAAVVDFFDGFIARMFKASSELGKQLDSLSDVVSFGVAPSMIIYQFLRMSYAQDSGGLDASFIALIPAFLVAAAAAYRLGKFNIDTRQSYGFLGVPTPAVGLMIASFPLIHWFADSTAITNLLLNKWFWYAVVLIVSYLMISNLPMLAMKFKGLTLSAALPFIIIAVVGIAGFFFLQWMTVPLMFITYVLVSLLFKNQTT